MLLDADLAMLPSPMARHVEIGTGLVRGSGLLDSRRSLWLKKRYMIFLRSWPLCAERSQMNHIENFKLSRGGYSIFESVRVWVKIGAQLHSEHIPEPPAPTSLARTACTAPAWVRRMRGSRLETELPDKTFSVSPRPAAKRVGGLYNIGPPQKK